MTGPTECPTCESRDRSMILSSCRYEGGPHDWHHDVERLTNTELADLLEASNVHDALWCDPASLVAAEIRLAVRRLRDLDAQPTNFPSAGSRKDPDT